VNPSTETIGPLGVVLERDAALMAARVLRLARVHEKAIARTEKDVTPGTSETDR
jgi:hypothetical protein